MYVKALKRYAVIFERWSHRIFNQDVEYFDDVKDMNKHINLINSIYKNEDGEDCFGNTIHTGFVAIDFQTEKILQWSPSKQICQLTKDTNILKLKDIFFRKDDEIPKNYKWDDGEYDGWLQFRWGDGKNAIGYKEKKEKRNNDENLYEEFDNNEQFDEQAIFDKQIEKEKLKLIENRW